MTRLECITNAYLLAAGKATLPTGNKLAQLNALAIKFYRDWQVEPDTEWNSLYQVVSAGTVTATDTFDLDTEINFISKQEGNYVRIKTTDGQYISYQTVKPQQLYQYRTANAVAHIVTDGVHQVKFSKPFVAGTQPIGGTIEVPAIIKLDDLTSDSSEVLIDQPEWLSERVAAQYAYSYKSTRDMYDDLLALANEHMISMKAANTSGTESYQTGIDYFALNGNVGFDY